jgi:hypothetical protein
MVPFWGLTHVKYVLDGGWRVPMLEEGEKVSVSSFGRVYGKFLSNYDLFRKLMI